MKPSTQAEAYEPLVPGFHIPAVTCWIRHNGKRLYEGLCKDEMKDWSRRHIPSVMKHFDQPIERWSFWQRRLSEVAKGGSDDFVRNSAELAVGYMQDIVDAEKL